jgi:hypothetical protein
LADWTDILNAQVVGSYIQLHIAPLSISV